MLRSIVSSIAPLFSNMGGSTRTGSQRDEAPIQQQNALLDAIKVNSSDLSLQYKIQLLTSFL